MTYKNVTMGTLLAVATKKNMSNIQSSFHSHTYNVCGLKNVGLKIDVNRKGIKIKII